MQKFSAVAQKISHAIGKMTLHDPSMAGHDTGKDRDRIRRGVLYGSESDSANGKTEEDDGDANDDDENADGTNEDKGTYFGGQRRYGKSPVKYGGRHRNEEGKHGRRNFDDSHRRHGRHIDRRRTHDGRRSQAFDRRCFNCGSPNCMLSTCPEPRNEERIRANLDAWRKLRKLNKPLRQVNLGEIDDSSCTISEALSAEIFLEHASTTKSSESNYLATADNVPTESSPLDFGQPTDPDDATIFWTPAHFSDQVDECPRCSASPRCGSSTCTASDNANPNPANPYPSLPITHRSDSSNQHSNYGTLPAQHSLTSLNNCHPLTDPHCEEINTDHDNRMGSQHHPCHTPSDLPHHNSTSTIIQQHHNTNSTTTSQHHNDNIIFPGNRDPNLHNNSTIQPHHNVKIKLPCPHSSDASNLFHHDKLMHTPDVQIVPYVTRERSNESDISDPHDTISVAPPTIEDTPNAVPSKPMPQIRTSPNSLDANILRRMHLERHLSLLPDAAAEIELQNYDASDEVVEPTADAEVYHHLPTTRDQQSYTKHGSGDANTTHDPHDAARNELDTSRLWVHPDYYTAHLPSYRGFVTPPAHLSLEEQRRMLCREVARRDKLSSSIPTTDNEPQSNDLRTPNDEVRSVYIPSRTRQNTHHT